MEFPTYNKHDAPLIDPIDVYRGFLWDDLPERQVAWSFDLALNTASRLIVRSMCDPDDDGSRLRIAQQALSARLDSETSASLTGSVRELRLTAAMLEYQNPEIADAQKELAHALAINNLRTNQQSLINAYRRKDGASSQDDGSEMLSAVGAIAHYTALGLLTRLKHPRLLAVSALPHQDYGHIQSRNFDIAVVETFRIDDSDLPLDTMDETDSQVYKVQVKSGCIGDCPTAQQFVDRAELDMQRGRNLTGRAQTLIEEREGLRSRYASDIRLVSGCCDLRASSTKPGASQNYTTEELLILEFNGLATGQEVALLDQLSNGLLLTITGNPERQGYLDADA